MTIYLLNQEEYNALLSIQEKHPRLTFQNVGFQYINPNTLNEGDKEALKQVSDMLNKHVEGFVKFNNFLKNKAGELVLRFQYQWSRSFTGVGYITLRELLNGFDNA